MTREDRTLVENEGVNAASGDDEQQQASLDDLLRSADEAAPDRTEEQPETGDIVGAPEQIPGKPGQQLEAGEG